jgi:hypothetical protein
MNKEGKIVPALSMDINGKNIWYAPVEEFLPSQLYPSEKTEVFFPEDDQAGWIGMLRDKFPEFFFEKSPDGKPLMSHSFQMIDFGIERKHIYPDIKIAKAIIHSPGNSVPNIFHIKFETYLRKKLRGKYYLQKFYMECEIPTSDVNMELILGELNHFNAGVYKSIILGKVDLKLIFPQHMGPARQVFELDPDQTPEEDRLQPDTRPV